MKKIILHIAFLTFALSAVLPTHPAFSKRVAPSTRQPQTTLVAQLKQGIKNIIKNFGTDPVLPSLFCSFAAATGFCWYKMRQDTAMMQLKKDEKLLLELRKLISKRGSISYYLADAFKCQSRRFERENQVKNFMTAQEIEQYVKDNAKDRTQVTIPKAPTLELEHHIFGDETLRNFKGDNALTGGDPERSVSKELEDAILDYFKMHHLPSDYKVDLTALNHLYRSQEKPKLFSSAFGTITQEQRNHVLKLIDGALKMVEEKIQKQYKANPTYEWFEAGAYGAGIFSAVVLLSAAGSR